MGVLDGLTVLDLSWGVSGPATAMLLADNGADVTRIERPGADPFAGWLDGKVYNRGKRSAVLDLTDADDVARFRKLAATADVVIESFAPGVTKKLGIDFDTLAATNPRLVYCSITGYGADVALRRPSRHRPARRRAHRVPVGDARVAGERGRSRRGRRPPR